MQQKITCPIKATSCNDLVARNLRSYELQDVMNLLSRSFPTVYPRQKNFWRGLIKNHDSFVMEKDGTIIGIMNLRGSREPEWIDLFAIDPQYQGQGYGTKLLEASESIVKKFGTNKMSLHTEQASPKNVAFYSRNGYLVTEFTKWGYENGHRLTLEKTLR